MNVNRIRQDFPVLERQIDGQPLIYLDNAATTHKPRQVLETIQAFYTTYNANIHRSPHRLGQEASELYEQAHRSVARFVDDTYSSGKIAPVVTAYDDPPERATFDNIRIWELP